MRDRFACIFCSQWSCKWPQKKNRSCTWCAWCISEQVHRRVPWHRSNVWRYWISQGSPEHDAEVLLELLSFVEIQFQNSPPTQKVQMNFCNQLIKSSHCNTVTLSWEILFWKSFLGIACLWLVGVQSLCEPPFIKKTLPLPLIRWRRQQMPSSSYRFVMLAEMSSCMERQQQQKLVKLVLEALLGAPWCWVLLRQAMKPGATGWLPPERALHSHFFSLLWLPFLS